MRGELASLHLNSNYEKMENCLIREKKSESRVSNELLGMTSLKENIFLFARDSLLACFMKGRGMKPILKLLERFLPPIFSKEIISNVCSRKCYLIPTISFSVVRFSRPSIALFEEHLAT